MAKNFKIRCNESHNKRYGVTLKRQRGKGKEKGAVKGKADPAFRGFSFVMVP